jgi:3',5'-cyclic AMP phosphodiesterase CpdA
VSDPFLLVHLSDPHIGSDWGGGDAVGRFAAVVEAVRALGTAPEAVLVSGDLTHNAADGEYRQVRELLAPLDASVHVLPGNHDAREAMRRHFELPGAGGEPVQYAVDIGPVRLVVLDTTVPGDDAGELDEARLDWLDGELAAAAGRPTLVAMHHPPLLTGIPVMDRVGLAAESRDALAAVLDRHDHAVRILAGHMHRSIAGDVAGRPVVVAPSCYLAVELDFDAQQIVATGEPPGFAVHALLDGRLISHVVAVV